MVVAGLILGNKGKKNAMSESTIQHLDSFWELVDVILNAVLFLLIGLELLILESAPMYIGVSIAAIPLVLIARFISVGLPLKFLSYFREFSPNAIKILTWGGLRGGISVALALSLPMGPHRDLILTMTYFVVVFSILIQGTSIKKLVRVT